MSMAKTQAMDNKWPRETASMPRPVGSTLQQLCLEQQNDILAQSPSCPTIESSFFSHFASLIAECCSQLIGTIRLAGFGQSQNAH